MSWQKCPVCEGSGKIIDTYKPGNTGECKTCRGRGIIHSDTGLPPPKPQLQGHDQIDLKKGN